MLLVGAEGTDLVHERREEGLGRASAVSAEGIDETLLAELLARASKASVTPSV